MNPFTRNSTHPPDADDEVVYVGENIRDKGVKATMNGTTSNEEELDVLKDVLKLCRWQNKKVK